MFVVCLGCLILEFFFVFGEILFFGGEGLKFFFLKELEILEIYFF